MEITYMKKLILIAFLFLITPNAKADMDYICYVKWDENYQHKKFIANNCQRNNILLLVGIKNVAINEAAFWCRKDREINFKPFENTNRYSLSCVLYGASPRKVIK